MKPQELFDAFDRGEKVEWRLGRGKWFKWNGGSWDVCREYRVVKPKPQLVPHWLAIVKVDGCYYLRDVLYSNDVMAKKEEESLFDFVRLATELPPIMLEV